MSSHGTFATAINCMDGRTQLPVNGWAKKKFGVDFIDTITEPGPDKILAAGNGPLFESIKNRVRISVEKHGSQNIVIVAHDDCAGYPVDETEHRLSLQKARENVAKWGFPAKVHLVWLAGSFQAEEIA